MSVYVVKLIDEFGEIEKVIGNINTDIIKKINLLAKEMELPFLSLLDEMDCNIYNYMQAKEIKKELMVCEEKYSITKIEFGLIIQAVERVIAGGEYTYLKIANLQKDREIIRPSQQFLK